MKEKKSIEFNFVTFIIIIAIIIGIVFIVARNTGVDKKINIGLNENKEIENKEEKLYTNAIIKISNMKEVSKIDSNDVKEKAKQTAKGAAKKVVKRVFTAKVLIALIVVIIFVVLAGSILKLFDFDTHWSEDEPGSPNTYTGKAQLDVKVMTNISMF